MVIYLFLLNLGRNSLLTTTYFTMPCKKPVCHIFIFSTSRHQIWKTLILITLVSSCFLSLVLWPCNQSLIGFFLVPTCVKPCLVEKIPTYLYSFCTSTSQIWKLRYSNSFYQLAKSEKENLILSFLHISSGIPILYNLP
jgi:hypothetical protein